MYNFHSTYSTFFQLDPHSPATPSLPEWKCFTFPSLIPNFSYHIQLSPFFYDYLETQLQSFIPFITQAQKAKLCERQCIIIYIYNNNNVNKYLMSIGSILCSQGCWVSERPDEWDLLPALNMHINWGGGEGWLINKSVVLRIIYKVIHSYAVFLKWYNLSHLFNQMGCRGIGRKHRLEYSHILTCSKLNSLFTSNPVFWDKQSISKLPIPVQDGLWEEADILSNE